MTLFTTITARHSEESEESRFALQMQAGFHHTKLVRWGRALVLILGLLAGLCSLASAQVQVGDDLKMNLTGVVNGGYTASYGDQIPSTHGLTGGGNANLTGIYYDPNFINFSINPYYDQSRQNSSFQSVTDASGVNANANFFTGTRFPGSISYNYARNSTGTFGLVGTPNFTTIGDTQGFGIGWSVLIPDKPTLSASYSQGDGNGNIFGTNEQSSSSQKTLNLRSNYDLLGWRLTGQYQHISINNVIPTFLSGELGKTSLQSTGNSVSASGYHRLPWNGSLAVSYSHNTYSGDYGSSFQNSADRTDYTTNLESATVNFHPTSKVSLFADEQYIDNLNGFLYQTVTNNGTNGQALFQQNSTANSWRMAGGASYNFTRNLYGQAQVTWYDQTYFGKTYQGEYFTGTVGYGKRILDIFTVSASVIESSNKWQDNSLGFIGNLNAFHYIGPWELSGHFSYTQNVETLLVTYNTSYYNYGAQVHRKLRNGMRWTGAFNGSHTGFTRDSGTLSRSQSYSTSLSMRRFTLNGNYSTSRGQALLTSSGIQPITQPGLPEFGLIVYNGKSYGGGVTITPIPRFYISASYARAFSDTLSATPSHNQTNVFYAQLQYRLRQISLLAGYQKFGQSISAVNSTTPGNQYSYFIGVTRAFNFF